MIEESSTAMAFALTRLEFAFFSHGLWIRKKTGYVMISKTNATAFSDPKTALAQKLSILL